MQPAPEPATPNRSRLPYVIVAVVVVIAVAVGIAIAKGVLFGSSTEPSAGSTADPGPATSTPSTSGEPSPSPRTTAPSRTPDPDATAARPGGGTPLTLPVTYQVPSTARMFRVQLLTGHIQLGASKDELVLDFDYNRSKPTKWIEQERSYATKYHRPMRPLQVDGGTGFAYDDSDQGKQYANYVVARAGLTVRVWAQSSGSIDPALRARAEQVIRSIRFEPNSLMQPSKGSSSQLALPFRYAPPQALGSRAPEAKVTSHLVEYLVDAGQYVEVSGQAYRSVEQATTYFDQKKSELEKTTAARQGKLKLKDVRTESSTRNNIGRLVDKGYGFVSRQQGIGDMLLFFTVQKGNTLVTVRADGHDRELRQSAQDAAIGALVTMRFTG